MQLQVWSAQTGLLQCSCRGHTAEITDLSVSADNALFASASNDRTVRTWSLKVSFTAGRPVRDRRSATLSSAACLVADRRAQSGRSQSGCVLRLQAGDLGESRAVLVGHTNVVSFVEFCPAQPGALLSSSFDGTCRIWHAADASVPAIVLQV